MIRILFFIGLAVLGFFFFRWLAKQPRTIQWRALAGILVFILLLLVATGRAHWLAAAFAAALAFMRLLLPLLGQLPLLKRVLGGLKNAQASSGTGQNQTSTVQSRYITMTLNHGSGEIDGEVLEGVFQGRFLSQLTLEELLALLTEYQDDDESVALLQAFLDRKYEDTWREHSDQQGAEQADREPQFDSGQMSRDEALQILGLSPDAGEEEIVVAHRRLMQTIHPDRGGSAYLASQINRAKETLLG